MPLDDSTVSDFVAEQQRRKAVANDAAGLGVDPQVATRAIANAPASGVPASIGMSAPEVGQGLADQQRQGSILAASPPVASFAASDAAKAAASKDSWGGMASLASAVSAYTNDFSEVKLAAKGVMQSYQASVEQNAHPSFEHVLGFGKGGSFDMLSQLGNLASATGQDIVPPLRGLIKGEAALSKGAATGIVNTFGPGYDTSPFRLGPDRPLTRDEGIAQWQQNFRTALLGLMPAEGKLAPVDIGASTEVPKEPPLPPGRGLPGPKGSVPAAAPTAAPEFTDFTVEPSLYTSEALKPAGVAPVDDIIHSASAEADAAHIAAMEEQVANLPLYSRSPALIKDFLENHTEAGDTSVYVDARKIGELYAQGHQPFSALAGPIADALASGSPVEMPLSTYLADVSGKPYADELRAATRFTQDGVSQDEAKELKPKEETEVTEPTPKPALEIPADVPVAQHDEVRSIAANAEQAIDEVFKEHGIAQLFTDGKALGLTKASFNRYGNAIDDLRAAVRDKVLERTYNQLRRERTPEWKKEVAGVLPWVTDAIENNSAVTAMRQLIEKGFKLDRDTVAEFYPGSTSRLPAGVLKANGNHPDAVADFLGYDSGAQLVDHLADLADTIKASGAKNLNEWVKAQAQDAAESQARSNFGYDITPDGLLDAAREAMAEVPIEKYLTSELKALAQEAGLPFNASDVEAAAQDQFDKLTTKQATNPRAFARNMWKLGNETQAALEKGNWAKAFDGRQKQFINYLQLQQAYKAVKQFRTMDNLLEKWSNKKFVKNMDALSGAILQDAAGKMNYSLGRDEFELKRFLANARDEGKPWDVQSLNDAANLAGYPIEYLPQPITPAGVKGELPPAMAWGDFRDYMTSLNALAKYGQELHSIEVHGKDWQLTDFANSVEASADALGRKWTAQELRDIRYTAFGQLRSTTQSILVSNLRPEVYLHWLDGQVQGPLMSLVNGLQKGKYLETDLSTSWTNAMRAVGKSGKLYSSMSQRLTIPDSMRVQTVRGPVSPIENRGNLCVALMHLGSQSARKKLLGGFGWGDEEEKWMIDQATPEEWEMVKEFWKQNDDLFKRADEMYQRFRGHGLVKDELRPVLTKEGEVIPGGHIHIQYDADLKDLLRIQDVNNVQALYGTKTPGGDVMSSHPAGALPSAFYSIKRTGFVGPILLDHRAIASGVAEVIHDIAFREALTNAQKGLTDPRVGDAMKTVLGPEYEKQMVPWLRYIAQERMLYDPATEKVAKFVRRLSQNATWAEVAYSVSTSLKHSGVGLMHMATEVSNPLALARAGWDTLGFGPRVKMWQKFIEDNSGEVRGIKFNNDASISELLHQNVLEGGAYADYKRAGFALFTMFKQLEARATWLAKYRTAISENGNHDLSVNIADKAVRDTQGAGHAVDLAPMLRQTETAVGALGNLVATRLMGFRNTAPNRLFTAKRQLGQAGRALSQGGIGKASGEAGKAGAGIIGFIVLPALWIAAQDIFLKGGGDQKQKNKSARFGEEAAWGLGEQTVGALPGGALVLEALRYSQSRTDAVSEAFQNAKKVASGKGKRGIALAINAFGTLTGTLPISGGNALQAIYDEMHSDLQSDEYSPEAFIQRAVLNRAPKYKPSHSHGRSHR